MSSTVRFARQRSLGRMLLIHQELANHRAPNSTTLAAKLGVTPKTIRRDIETMVKELKLPIEYDAAEHAYSYTQEVSSFPLLQVSEGEILALFAAHQSMTAYAGTPFEKPLQSAFTKLAQTLKGEFTIDLGALDQALSYKNTGVAEADLMVFDFVKDAILTSREISFKYHKLEGKNSDLRHVRPYHIGCINQQWYLFAYDLDREAMRTFVISRIRGPLKKGKKFTKPKDFSLADHLQGSFGVFSANGVHQEVILDFTPFCARLISERQWHPTQTLQPHKDGRLTLTLELGSLEEIERWILGWGPHVHVISPPTLRDRIQQLHQAAAAQYAQPAISQAKPPIKPRKRSPRQQAKSQFLKKP